jgi:hypothetical protein
MHERRTNEKRWLVIMTESMKFAEWASTEKIYPTTSLFSFTAAFYIPG